MDQMGPDSPDFVQSPKILQSLGSFVQQLIIYFCSEDSLSAFLDACPNVHHLTIHLQITAAGTVTLNRLLLGLQGMTRLTRLTVALSSLGFSRQNCQTLSQACLNITHLDLYVPNCYPWEGQWEILSHLPKLTHLLVIVRYVLEVNVVVKLLKFCQHLKILACMISHYSNVGNYDALDTDDNRLVLLVEQKSISVWGRAPKFCVGAMIVSEHVVFARGSEYYLFNFSVTWFPY
jgi:hypothetical protein